MLDKNEKRIIQKIKSRVQKEQIDNMQEMFDNKVVKMEIETEISMCLYKLTKKLSKRYEKDVDEIDRYIKNYVNR